MSFLFFYPEKQSEIWCSSVIAMGFPKLSGKDYGSAVKKMPGVGNCGRPEQTGLKQFRQDNVQQNLPPPHTHTLQTNPL